MKADRTAGSNTDGILVIETENYCETNVEMKSICTLRILHRVQSEQCNPKSIEYF